MRETFFPHLKMYQDLHGQRNAMYVCHQDLLNREVQKQRIQSQCMILGSNEVLNSKKKEKSVKLRRMRMLGRGGNIAGGV